MADDTRDPEEETRAYEKEARALRRRAKANQAMGRMLGDEERQARGRTQETLAEVREYAVKLSETNRRSERMGEE